MFSKNLKEKRKLLNLTQQEVANQLHVTRQTISNWETGKSYPDIPTLIEISNFYKLSVDFMLKGDEQFMDKIKKDTRLLKYLKIGFVLLIFIIFAPGVITAIFDIGVQLGEAISLWF